VLITKFLLIDNFFGAVLHFSGMKTPINNINTKYQMRTLCGGRKDWRAALRCAVDSINLS